MEIAIDSSKARWNKQQCKISMDLSIMTWKSIITIFEVEAKVGKCLSWNIATYSHLSKPKNLANYIFCYEKYIIL